MKKPLEDRLTKARRTAIARQDASVYFDLCNKQGVHPEDEYLFKQWQMPQGDKRTTEDKYEKFLQETIDKEIAVGSLEADSKRKREIFQRHFPHQYRAQRLERVDDVRLGAVYKKLVEHAKK